MTISRQHIVKEARSWLGTRFHHQGRVKTIENYKGGCDCLGLLMGVARDLELCSPVTGEMLICYDQTDYSHFPDGVAFRAALKRYLKEIPLSDRKSGDIALFHFDKNPQHVAIISDYQSNLGLIHCYAQARKVVEHRLDEAWKKRMVAVYRISEVAEAL